ncbi:hypothetical protein ACFZCP_20000 [Streptomyces sp. NPDC007971]|uniref:hypothetical protein n=1 Tax=Streptomyces sp. NPDC007971 TaxID=3364799 RepID=UPI0036EC8E68
MSALTGRGAAPVRGAIPVAFRADRSPGATNGDNANSTAPAVAGTARGTPPAAPAPHGSRPPGHARHRPTAPLDDLRADAAPGAGS